MLTFNDSDKDQLHKYMVIAEHHRKENRNRS